MISYLLAKSPGPGEVTTKEPGITNPVLSNPLRDLLSRDNPGFLFLQLLLHNLIVLIFVIAILVFFFMFIIGGIQWMTSGGDKAATESARGKLTAAIIGLVIVFLVYAILNLIEILFGFDLTRIDISRLFLK
jgi:hypothetical protein